MRITGIYKITNLTNGKYYIGQSRDVYTRWKAHTISLSASSSESVIRMAFAKYGLRKQVAKEGIYDNFQFEVIEQCEEDAVLDKEAFYIQTLKPEYNVQLMGATPFFVKRDTQKAQYYMQYHSFEKMGYLPGETDDASVTTENGNYGIFTRKRVAVNMLGASVALILGGKPDGCTHNRYYLWSELTVEDIQFDKSNQTYVVQGIENLQREPLDLTDLEGFEEFKMKCGNFAYGLQSMKNKPFFFDKILPLIRNNRIQNHISYGKWIDNFLDRENRIHLNSSQSSNPG